MESKAYVREKLLVAISCMCGDGSFKERLENATVSSLIRLDGGDLSGDLGKDLEYILQWTKDNMLAGELQSLPGETERKKIIDMMLHLALETCR